MIAAINIIVVFPKLEDAKNIRNLLARNGYSVIGVCCTGAQVLQIIDNLEDGIVICGYRFNDMMYAEEMIYKIEKRTGVDFRNIKIKGQKEDFTGLRFFNGGWKRDFWGNFPSKDEIEAYIKLKNGKR